MTDLQVDKKDLLRSLNRGTITQTSMYKHIRIDVLDGQMNIISKDSTVTLISNLSVYNTKDFSFCIEGEVFLNVIRKFPFDKVDINLTQEHISICSTGINFEIPIIDSSDFFYESKLEAVNIVSIELEIDKVIALLKNTQFAMYENSSRYNLHGLYLGINNNRVETVALDGHRLAKMTTIIPKTANSSNQEIIIPAKTVYELLRILQSPDLQNNVITIIFNHKQVSFSTHGLTLISKLVLGEYPQYNDIIRHTYNNQLRIKCDVLMSAIDRITAISNEKFKCVKISMSPNQVELSLFKNTANKGRASEIVPTNYYEYIGESLTIGFNARYVMDILNVIDKNDNVVVNMTSPDKSAIFKSQTIDALVFMVMPVKV